MTMNDKSDERKREGNENVYMGKYSINLLLCLNKFRFIWVIQWKKQKTKSKGEVSCIWVNKDVWLNLFWV